MARVFVAASSQYLEIASSPVTATPLTISAWFKPNAITGENDAIFLSRSSGSGWWMVSRVNEAVFSDVWDGSAESTSYAYASGNALVAGVWSHAAGVFASSTSNTAYSKGIADGVETTSSTPTSVDRLTVGARGNHTTFWDGSLAEVAIWNVALSAGDIVSLAAGRSPMSLATAPLRFWRFKDDLDLTDLIAGSVLTNSGSTWTSDHPTVDDPPGSIPGGWPGGESLSFPAKQRAPMPMIAGPREDRIMSMQGRQKG